MIGRLIKEIVGLIKFLLRLVATVLLIAACIFVDARYIEPKLLQVKEITVQTDQLTLDTPLKIVQFSDTHLGAYYTVSDLQNLVDKINALSPDVIVFTGDLIDDNKEFAEEEETVSVLGQLKSKYGNFAIFGNHDHGSNGTKRYTRIIQNSGFTLLKDSTSVITLDNGEKLSVIGIDDIVLGKPQLINTVKAAPTNTYQLLLSHAPDVADQAASCNVDLQLSGHTHGGQVRLPIVGALFTPQYGKQYIKGMYQVGAQEMPLYVSTGIGMSQLPLRFLNPPELVVLSLTNE